MTEQFVNKAIYLLQSACLATDTTLTLQGVMGLPTVAGSTFRLRMVSEILEVTGVNPNTNQIVVVRGTENTVAYGQPVGTPLVPILTSAGLQNFAAGIQASPPQFADQLSSYSPFSIATRQFLMVDGYAATDDGGGGTFVWNPEDTRTADNGTIFQVSGVSTGRWNRVFEGHVLNIQWFGANTSAADNTTAINNCLASCGPNGGNSGRRPYVPTGTWNYTGTLLCPPGVIIIGDGVRSSILNKTTIGHCVESLGTVNVPGAGGPVGATQLALQGAYSLPTFSGGVFTGSGVWAANVTYTPGQRMSPTRLSPILLECVTGGTSGNYEPIGTLYYNNGYSSSPAPTITLTGTPIADDLIDIEIVSGGLLGSATFQVYVNGVASGSVTATASAVSIANGYTANFAAGSYTTGAQYTAPSFRWSLSTAENIPDGSGTLVWKPVNAGAGWHDLANSPWLDYVVINNCCVGVALDQSEDATFHEVNVGGTCEVSYWLANGSEMAPDAPTLSTLDTTNVIRWRGGSIAGLLGIVDSGGAERSAIGVNMSTGAPTFLCGVLGFEFLGCYYEQAGAIGLAGGSAAIYRMCPTTLFSRQPDADPNVISASGCFLHSGVGYIAEGYSPTIFGQSAGSGALEVASSYWDTTQDSAIHGADKLRVIWRYSNVGAGDVPILDVQGANQLIEQAPTQAYVTNGSSPYSALSSDDVILCDNSSTGAVITIELPASPAVDETHTVKWWKSQSPAAGSVTVSGNGNDIEAWSGSTGSTSATTGSTSITQLGGEGTWKWVGAIGLVNVNSWVLVN
jgi:hypothetical protein